MAIDRSEFTIRIKSESDMKALDESKLKLADLGKTANDSGNVIKISSKEAGDIISKMGESGKEAGEKMSHAGHEAELSHRELREAVHAVGQQFGGLADVGLWLSPQLAALAAVLFAVDKLKEHFEELVQKEIEAAKAAREFKADSIQALADASRAAATAMSDYERSATAAANAEDRTTQAMQDQLALLAARIESQKQLAEAEEKAYETEIDRKVALHEMTQDEGERAKDIARERLRNQDSELDRQREQETIAAHQRELDEARQRLPQEQRELSAAVAAEKQPGVNKANLEKELARQQKVLEQQQGSLDEQIGHHNAPTPLDKWNRMARYGVLGQDQAVADEAKGIELQKQIVDAQEQYIESLKSLIGGNEEAAKNAKAHADEIAKKILKAQELDRTGDQRIDQEQQIADIHANTRAGVAWNAAAGEASHEAVTHAETQRRILAGRGTPREIAAAGDEAITNRAAHETGPQAGLDAADAVARARTINANMQGVLRGQASPAQLQEIHSVLDQMAGFLENHSSNVRSQQFDLQSAFQQLSQRLSALETQVATNRTY
jgi:hypothetical protein